MHLIEKLFMINNLRDLYLLQLNSYYVKWNGIHIRRWVWIPVFISNGRLQPGQFRVGFEVERTLQVSSFVFFMGLFLLTLHICRSIRLKKCLHHKHAIAGFVRFVGWFVFRIYRWVSNCFRCSRTLIPDNSLKSAGQKFYYII